MIEGALVSFAGFTTGLAYQKIVFANFGVPSIYAATGFIVALLYCGAIRLSGGTSQHGVSTAGGRVRSALSVWTGTFVLLVVIAFAMKIGATFSRGSIFSFFFVGIPVVVVGRVYLPRILARTLSANAHRGSEAIIAAPRGLQAVIDLSFGLRAQGCSGVHTIEFDANCDAAEWAAVRQRLLKHIIDTARVAGPGEIYVLSGSAPDDRISSIRAGLRLVPRAVYVVPADTVSALLGRPIHRVGAIVAVETQKEPLSAVSRGVKRAIDLVTSIALLVLLLPAFTLIALAIKIDSEGPVFFMQRRNGYRGREFRIIKFRTMTVLEDGADVAQAKRGDRRVTRVGAWLRKMSFDELPQLINILRGEMSLVGPRPHAVAHDELYAKLIENYELRQHVRPGVTGWAQVNGMRGETPTVDLMWHRIEFDLWYASNCSVMLDLQILFRTVFAVLRQENAY